MNRLLLLTLIFITSCTVGPNFKLPEISESDTWATISNNQLSQTNTTLTFQHNWWESYHDPILSSLINRAKDSNLDLKQAVSKIRQARASRTTIASSLFPSINSSATFQESDSDFNATSNNSGLFQAGLDASWELDIFGGIRRNIESADAEIIVQVENRNDLIVTLTSEVALNYLSLRGFQQELVITNLNLAAQKKSVDVTEKLFNAGFTGKLDYLNATAQLATTESQVPSLEANIQKTIYTLSVLLGLEPEVLNAELLPLGTIPSVPAEIAVGLPSELLRRRPDIRQAEARLHSATAKIGVAVADLFPKFTLNGSINVQANSASNLTAGDNSFWSFGPGVSLPIFNAGKLRANVKIQEEIQEQALIEYEKTILKALKETNSALVDYQREQESRLTLEQAVNANLQAVEIAQELYRTGQTDFLNVLVTQRSLYSTQSALIQSTRTIATNLVAIYKALGGGWETGK